MAARPKFAFYYAGWANLQAKYSAYFYIAGALISLWYPNKLLAIANLVIGAFILALEWPLPQLKAMPFLGDNYYFRTLLYLGFVVPGMVQAATHTSALCLACAALTYLRAAVNGEPDPPKPAKDAAGGGGGGGRK
ncbi:hypothetical protein BC831DRAFT_446753 [Entophlyctis helioformis]|nr:hypothetical protein BC831DRAFT_446753 [Entophlyctis helioformis]